MSLNTIYESDTHKIESVGVIDNTHKPIRIISTGSMQRRFTISEEVFIASDDAATVIKSRLLNASYCDLDYQDTIDGVNYICGVLQSGAVIIDATARAVELLQDGNTSETYNE